MLSNLIITDKQSVLFVDEIGIEIHSEDIIVRCLNEQNVQNFIKYNQSASIPDDIKQNVILAPISVQLLDTKISDMFLRINSLVLNKKVTRFFNWVTTKKVPDPFVIACLKHMAEIVITLKTRNTLTILIKKSKGNASFKWYTYDIDEVTKSISVKEFKEPAKPKLQTNVVPDDLGTFKIKLEDEEMMARNSLQLPYEKAIGGGNETTKESKIIYDPSTDYFDDEDPDDDLDI